MIRRSKRVLLLWMMLGFFVGILYANLIPEDYMESFTVFGSFFQNSYSRKNIVIEDLFVYLLILRGLPAVILLIPGHQRLRTFLAVFVLVWTGFSAGTYITAGVVLMQMQGLVLAVVSVFPQAVFYVPAYFLVVWNLYAHSENQWNHVKTIAVIVLILAGILSECYINTIFLQLFVNIL